MKKIYRLFTAIVIFALCSFSLFSNEKNNLETRCTKDGIVITPIGVDPEGTTGYEIRRYNVTQEKESNMIIETYILPCKEILDPFVNKGEVYTYTLTYVRPRYKSGKGVANINETEESKPITATNGRGELVFDEKMQFKNDEEKGILSIKAPFDYKKYGLQTYGTLKGEWSFEVFLHYYADKIPFWYELPLSNKKFDYFESIYKNGESDFGLNYDRTEIYVWHEAAEPFFTRVKYKVLIEPEEFTKIYPSTPTRLYVPLRDTGFRVKQMGSVLQITIPEKLPSGTKTVVVNRRQRGKGGKNYIECTDLKRKTIIDPFPIKGEKYYYYLSYLNSNGEVIEKSENVSNVICKNALPLDEILGFKNITYTYDKENGVMKLENFSLDPFLSNFEVITKDDISIEINIIDTKTTHMGFNTSLNTKDYTINLFEDTTSVHHFKYGEEYRRDKTKFTINYDGLVYKGVYWLSNIPGLPDYFILEKKKGE